MDYHMIPMYDRLIRETKELAGVATRSHQIAVDRGMDRDDELRALLRSANDLASSIESQARLIHRHGTATDERRREMIRSGEDLMRETPERAIDRYNKIH